MRSRVSEEIWAEAVRAVRDKEKSLDQAAADYGVGRTRLYERVRYAEKDLAKRTVAALTEQVDGPLIESESEAPRTPSQVREENFNAIVRRTACQAAAALGRIIETASEPELVRRDPEGVAVLIDAVFDRLETVMPYLIEPARLPPVAEA